MELAKRRKVVNGVALMLSLAAMVFGLVWLVWILFTTLQLGVAGLSLDLFTKMTPPPGSADGGLANAIVGSLLMVGLATLIGTPVGIMAGLMLATSLTGSAALALLTVTFPFFLSIRATLLRDIQRD